MNWKRVQLRMRWARKLVLIGNLFYFAETAYFLFAFGWHFSAINPAEEICDAIAKCMWILGLILFLKVLIDIVEHFLKNIK